MSIKFANRGSRKDRINLMNGIKPLIQKAVSYEKNDIDLLKPRRGHSIGPSREVHYGLQNMNEILATNYGLLNGSSNPNNVSQNVNSPFP